jgi:hypothetical protein
VTQYTEYGVVRPRSRRRLRTIVIAVIALIIVLVGLDFGSRALAENVMASQIQHQGFPKKPSVSVGGFPFLTQVISRDFSDVHLSSSNITEGPLEIASVSATMNGVHVNTSFNSGRIDRLSGTIDVTFTALANAMAAQAGPLASLGAGGLTLSRAGPNEVKATLDLVVTSGSAVWRVTRTGHNEINVHLVSSGGGLGSDVLSSIGDINVPLPSLPLGLSIQGISVTPNGLVGTVTGHNVRFGG